MPDKTKTTYRRVTKTKSRIKVIIVRIIAPSKRTCRLGSFKETDPRTKYIESISDILAKAVHGMFMEWKIHQQIVKIDGKYKHAPE